MAAYRFIRAITLPLALCALCPAQFKSSTPFTAGTKPTSIAIADFNGDGIPDLAITDPSLNMVTVLFGIAGGEFTTPGTPYLVGQHPVFLLAGDFNKDGYPDLVVANEFGGNITVLLNNQAGGFLPGLTYQTGQNPVFIAAVDWNGDGYPDLAIANGLDNTICVLTNDKSGGFANQAPGSPFAVGSFPSSIAVGDINADGQLDLAVANLSSNNITILLGSPGSTTSPPPAAFVALSTGPIAVPAGAPGTIGPIQSAPVSVAIGDVNDDGYPDLAIANEATNNVTVLLNNGKLGFTPSQFSPYALAGEPVFLAMADLNWDGHPDLAIVDQNGTVTVLLGSATGAFTAATGSPYTVGASPAALTVGDLNGDGKPDLAVADSGDSTVTVLLNGFTGLSVLSALTGTEPIAPGSLVMILGSGLAAAPVAAGISPLPMLLGGVSATITFSNNMQAQMPLYYVSPTQINAVVPQTPGPFPATAVVTVVTPTGPMTGPVSLLSAAPGLFTVSGGPNGVAYGEALMLQSFQISNVYSCVTATTTACVPNPINAAGGATELVLYGTGIQNAATSSIRVVIGGQSLTPVYSGATGTPGVDEVVVQVPITFAGKGVTTAAVSIGGVRSNEVMLAFQ